MPFVFRHSRFLRVLPLFLALIPLCEPRAEGRAEIREPHLEVRASNAVLDGDFPDPFVLHDRGAYYGFATGAGSTHVQVALSRDLTSWVRHGDALPRLPAWAARDEGYTWAPSVLRRPGGYVLYYTTRDAASGFQCISRATSEAPEGPYVDASSRPFICQVERDHRLCGSIDPSPFVDREGKAYLLWKSDENSAACRTSPRIWSQRLDDGGTELVGPPTPLIAMDREWEGPNLEGPAMVRRDGRYFLFYSANWYDSADYAIGYATCAGPMGPCTKVTNDAPFLKSSGAALGPGGQELFTDEAGDLWMAYHAWTAPKASYAAGGARSLHLDRMTFAPTAPLVSDVSAEEPRPRERP